VGFDVKAPAEDVAAITGVDGSGAANWRSLECLLDSGVAYECRTTVHWGLFDSERLWRLATRLRAMGVERFAVQLARPARQLDP
ncbi:anaerobic ribonucleoside-triphosphate reductase activating protein, partial [Pseudomonas aeruginosa]|nr:anaerobic ribonucleoside-triphosphate reductase activating protein [Pseudomonas aeruginosa]